MSARASVQAWDIPLRQCFSWLMPIPPYTRPRLRSSRDPSPFDKGMQRHPLRVLLDQPLLSGPTDGEGEFQGYPFTGGGSTGFPGPDALLRSLLGHPGFDVLFITDRLEHEGAVVFEDSPLQGDDALAFEVKTASGIKADSFSWYGEALDEAAAMTLRHHLDEAEALPGVQLYRAGNVLEADLIVTGREWLLAERGSVHLASVFSPVEAVALMGLYLRWHELPAIVGGAPARWHHAAMCRSAAFTALPAFQRWNQAGRAWHDAAGDMTLERLNQACLTRVARAFKSRDNVYALSATTADHDPEEMLYELDSLLFSLVAAFDLAARAVDRILQLGTSGTSCGWQYTDPRRWQSKLEVPARDLHHYTGAGTEMQRIFEVLRWLRNSVHHEALSLIRDDGIDLVTIPRDVQQHLKGRLREGHAGWDAKALGIRVLPPIGATAHKWLPGTGHKSVTVRRKGAPVPGDPLAGQLAIDVREFIGMIFPACLTALNEVMRLTPLGQVPGYTTALDNPPRVNLPWYYSDTTGHRLRMLFGISELGVTSRR